ncbi:MAG: phospho-N-acetylmuramoyl-pentapeptide-transferase [Clostridiales Family XIII bacterium]|jgi:phospho-N-acetylmuramoyl-pentapeptide-transferase|nr:phospho-N-acetylmuramoyl-pentapeptide-transferase [Clostridiales Family XIII bacterium]
MIESGLTLTMNMLLSLLSALLVTALITWRLIPFLKRQKTTQVIYDEAPERHKQKSGTPTMGGIAIICGILIGCLVAMLLVRFSANMGITLLVTVVFGLVGFLDDYTKINKKRNLGLTAKQKIALQLVVSLFVALYYVYVADLGTEILIPFLWKRIDIGLFIIPYIMFVMIAMVNSVNLTDGLDGLAGGVSTMLALFFPAITILGMNLGYGILTGTETGSELMNVMLDAMFFAALAGACLGFLIFNRHPAKIFMGDTGSLAIGGGISVAAIFVHMELFLPIVGLIFVLEALSDIIQVSSYRLRHGKRVFKMAPLHHHFELSGWSEKKVVTVFVGVTLFCAALSVATIMIQSAFA